MALRVRIAREEDQQNIKAFYKANPSEFIVFRPECEINAAIARGHYFLVEDRRTADIVAISAIFYYGEDEQNLVELSDTLVMAAFRGLGIQPFLFRMRIAYLIATHGEQVRISAAINSRNTASIKNQKNIGFQSWSADDIVFSSCASCSQKPDDKPCCCEYFILPDQAKKEAVAKALEVSESVSFVFTKDTHSEEVSFDLRFLEGEVREDLKEFVSR